MTQTAALAKYLLDGNVVSIMNAFQLFSMTNAPREISRQIEKKFGVVVSRTPIDFTSKYGHKGVYYQYRLNKTEMNVEGIKKMRDYIAKESNNGKQLVKTHIANSNQTYLNLV